MRIMHKFISKKFSDLTEKKMRFKLKFKSPADGIFPLFGKPVSLFLEFF